MELTQERLDQLRFVKADNGSTLALTRDEVINVIQEITGEKVTIVEPEPEIPDDFISVIKDALAPDYVVGNGYCAQVAERVAFALWKAGWVGLRK